MSLASKFWLSRRLKSWIVPVVSMIRFEQG